MKINDVELNLVQKLRMKIIDRFDGYLIKGLEMKGYKFNTLEELNDFVLNNCSVEIDCVFGTKTFLVNNKPFFIWYTTLFPEYSYTKEGALVMNFGYFEYVN